MRVNRSEDWSDTERTTVNVPVLRQIRVVLSVTKKHVDDFSKRLDVFQKTITSFSEKY